MAPPEGIEIPPEVLDIFRTLDRAGYQAWCVGGAVRDSLLGDGRVDWDHDVATSATPEEVRRLFKHTVAVGLRYGTVGVLDSRRNLHEVTTFRRDVRTFGRHAEVEFGASLEEDLARRDFTINAIAYQPLKREWRDPYGGQADLERGLLKAVGEPRERFREDYLRILRGLRFSARFQFEIEPATWQAAKEAVDGLAGLSAERVRDEWFKSLVTAKSLAHLVKLWHEVGSADIWLPELVQPSDVTEPDADSGVARDPVILTCLLCRDPSTVLRRLKASNSDIARAEEAERHPPHPAGDDEVAVRRWLSRVGDARDDLTSLWRLRNPGENWPWDTQVSAVLQRGDPLTRGDLALSGDDLLSAGVPRGPQLGAVLERLLEEVLERPEANTRDRLSELLPQVMQHTKDS